MADALSTLAAPAVADAFFDAPKSQQQVLDFTPVTSARLAAWRHAVPAEPIPWLAADHEWIDRASGHQRVPVPLCEFVAYRSALVYEREAIIRRNLGAAATDIAFFDSSQTKVADTQACAFVQDGLVFIVFRGTEAGKVDWTVNLEDSLTDSLLAAKAPQIARLVKRHGSGVGPVLEWLATRPGRHLGFGIAYGAVHEQIAAYLARRPAQLPVILAGHSLGGALAQLAALELQALGHPIGAVITFGAPLVGNQSFVDEFAAAGLAPKTLRFESTSDSVPRLLRRWYYRFNRGTQEWISRVVAPPERPPQDVRYALVNAPLAFEQQPLHSLSELKDAIRTSLAERAKKISETAKPRDTTQKPSSTPDGTKPSAPVSSTGGAAGQSGGEGGGTLVLWLFGGIVLFIAVVGLWLFYRHKIASHSISDRYALYLSTLTYQHIRTLQAGAPGTVAARLATANADLGHYLRTVRGETAATVTFYRDNKLADLPVRLSADLDLAALSGHAHHMV